MDLENRFHSSTKAYPKLGITMDIPSNLSAQKQIQLANFIHTFEAASRDQLITLATELATQLLTYNQATQDLTKHEWFQHLAQLPTTPTLVVEGDDFVVKDIPLAYNLEVPSSDQWFQIEFIPGPLEQPLEPPFEIIQLAAKMQYESIGLDDVDQKFTLTYHAHNPNHQLANFRPSICSSPGQPPAYKVLYSVLDLATLTTIEQTCVLDSFYTIHEHFLFAASRPNADA